MSRRIVAAYPVEKGRWYPAPPPALPGETDDTYTDRLIGVRGEELRPYDHHRLRQCSIGWHSECSRHRDRDSACRCPCHGDPDVLAARGRIAFGVDPAWALDICGEVDQAAAGLLARLYDLPLPTAQRVVHLAARAVDADEIESLEELAALLGRHYRSVIGDGFAIDVAWALEIHDHLEGCPPKPRREPRQKPRGKRRRKRRR